MSEHDMTDHGAAASSDEGPAAATTSNRLSRIVRSRYFVPGVTIAAVLVGFLLARRLGIGGNLLSGIGVVALMMVFHGFMHRGHGAHGAGEHGERGARDPEDTHRGHRGCH